jgi:hypothetical protein
MTSAFVNVIMIVRVNVGVIALMSVIVLMNV